MNIETKILKKLPKNIQYLYFVLYPKKTTYEKKFLKELFDEEIKEYSELLIETHIPYRELNYGTISYCFKDIPIKVEIERNKLKVTSKQDQELWQSQFDNCKLTGYFYDEDYCMSVKILNINYANELILQAIKGLI